MLGPYDNYAYANNPHDQSDNGVVLPFGWALPNNSEIMQNNNPPTTFIASYGEVNQSVLPESYFGVTKLYHSTDDWDIKDVILPRVDFHNKFESWPNGDCKFVYGADNIKARKHKCGWAMRNTNNHNKMILKKSCLGIIKCSKDCFYPDHNSSLALAPKISEGARRCQLNNKSCPNPCCGGTLIQQTCKGKSGNPVTHYWRFHHSSNSIYFMAKGVHDHAKPMSLLKVSDKKMKLRNSNEEGQFQNSLSTKQNLKQESLSFEMNSWNENLLSISNDYGNCSLIMNQCLPFKDAAALDLTNLNIERSIHSSMPFIKCDQTLNEEYISSADNMTCVTKYTPTFINDYSGYDFSPIQERPYSFTSLKREINDIQDGEQDFQTLQSHWTTDYATCDVLQHPHVDFNETMDIMGSNLRFLSNNELKHFSYLIE